MKKTTVGASRSFKVAEKLKRLPLDIWRSRLLWDEKMFSKMLGMHMSFLLPAAVGQLAFVIGWFLLIFYTKDLVKVSYSWLHWCACRSRVFPYYWLIWSMPWKHEWNPTRTLPNTHAACCELRFLARRFVWVDSVDLLSGLIPLIPGQKNSHISVLALVTVLVGYPSQQTAYT